MTVKTVNWNSALAGNASGAASEPRTASVRLDFISPESVGGNGRLRGLRAVLGAAFFGQSSARIESPLSPQFLTSTKVAAP